MSFVQGADMDYYAKSPNSKGERQTVKEHLSNVAALAEQFGAEFGLEAPARLAGQLHDFGKYSTKFHSVLARTADHVDHACGGALYLDSLTKGNPKYRPIIEAINGHHDGLLEYSISFRSALGSIVEGKSNVTINAGKTPAIQGKDQLIQADRAFRSDFPDFRPPKLSALSGTELDSMLYTRMIFSCLVDADYTASAMNDDETYLERAEDSNFDPKLLLQRLYQYRDSIRKSSAADTTLNAIRDEVFERCGAAGTLPEGLFTLTAPTGTGKTLALLHFALRHCLETGKKRIIIVLPFLTLAEQNTATYQKIVSTLLVDHSQSNLPEEARELASRWSAPVILTTSVRFFESLFANRPTDCRKLHNIANSVILFDEAQSLPAELTTATLQAVNELCKRYHTTMLFSTATQPDYSARRDIIWAPQEIMLDPATLFLSLQRVNVDWRIQQKTPFSEIAQEMATQQSVCVIVNLRRHAREIADALSKLCLQDEVFLLSTDLCPAHRSQVIDAIRERLLAGKPCRVVATQCIEAGVDLDFAVMYRALAPLDAIIQAAGRCNRNGRPEKGKVTVFIPDDERRLYPDDWYQNAAMVVQEMNPPFSIHDPENTRLYYQRLFGGAKDKQALRNAIAARSFQKTAEQYRLIDSTGSQLIVPYAGENERYECVVKMLKEQGVTRAVLKQAAPITITSFVRNLEDYAERLPFARHKHDLQQDAQLSNVFLLREQFKECYDARLGLQLPNEIPSGSFVL